MHHGVHNLGIPGELWPSRLLGPYISPLHAEHTRECWRIIYAIPQHLESGVYGQSCPCGEEDGPESTGMCPFFPLSFPHRHTILADHAQWMQHITPSHQHLCGPAHPKKETSAADWQTMRCPRSSNFPPSPPDAAQGNAALRWQFSSFLPSP